MKKEDAISYFGSAAELARSLNISEPAVSCWGDTVPKGRVYQVAHGNTQAEHFRLLLLKELSPTDLVNTLQLAARYIQEYQPK